MTRPSPTLPFGRYRGCRLDQVPEAYLVWLADNEASSPTWRALARRQLGLPDEAPEANDDSLQVGPPDRRPAALVLPRVVFDWQQRMEAAFAADPAARAVVARGLAELRALAAAVTGRRLPTDAELAAARRDLDEAEGVGGGA